MPAAGAPAEPGDSTGTYTHAWGLGGGAGPIQLFLEGGFRWILCRAAWVFGLDSDSEVPMTGEAGRLRIPGRGRRRVRF